VRLIDRLIRRDGYWEGVASGAAVLTTSYASADREPVLPQLAQFAQNANSSSSIVFSAILIRMALFSEATMKYQALDDKHLFGNQSLAKIEHPFGPDSTTGDLLARAEQDVSMAGNSYTWDPPGEDRLVRLRPDWTTIVSEVVYVDGGDPEHPGWYRRPVGYWHEPPKGVLDRGRGFLAPAEEVVHWHPVPDPAADFRGMSWLTPVMRDVQGDDGLTRYKIKYLENSASPNLLIRYAQKLQPGTVDSVRERMHARYGGVDNAFKTLVLDQGADVTVIGNSLAQMDFSGVSAVGVERILAAAMVPAVLAGLEPLRGAGRGFQESMQKFANIWARPHWRSFCGAFSRIMDVPAGNRLWFDTSDIAALQDGEMERGQAALVRAQALLALVQAGYTHESAIAAVDAMDLSQLKAGGVGTPSSSQPVQHMLPQQQPGATADPLPATMPRLPVGSTSPADGGNGSRPTPRPGSARRALEEANGHV
jgi:phage portal protein BeeE